ncbi:hypothetical protein SAMD00019534_003990, partial [Acytostelium subglobosum LB1]|uniref:hypothetical protein n=1 Tax=Acytostelium subglobosum LB1 TaxID=1410327 RepID=UPI000644DC05
MTLEATIICVDNSEWMRNCDFQPSRYDAQKDAVNLICAAKTQSNPESCVAILSMAGRSPEVLVTLTQDLSKILSSYNELKIQGTSDFTTSMQIAQLALRHRQNKNQHPRIVVFVGSPLKETKEELSVLAKRLKKNDIAVDIINFGEESVNVEKLDAFIKDVNKNDESHLLTVPAGPHILSDVIVESKIIVEGSGTYGAQFINADTDPELALALKLSLEEEQQRVERERKSREGDKPGSTSETNTDVQMSSNDFNFSDDPDLQQALALSLEQQSSEPMQTDSNPPQQQQQQPSTDAFNDQEFLNSTLLNLPGVNPNDERIKNAIQNLQKDEKKDQDKKDK